MNRTLWTVFSLSILAPAFAGQYHYSKWDWQEKMAEEGWVDLSETVKEEINKFRKHPSGKEVDVILCNRSEEAIQSCSIAFADTSFEIPTPINPRSIYVCVFRHTVSWEKTVGNLVFVATVHSGNRTYTDRLDDPSAVHMTCHELFLDADSTRIRLTMRKNIDEYSFGRMHLPSIVEFGRKPSFSILEGTHEKVVHELASIGNRLTPNDRSLVESLTPREATTQASIMKYGSNLSREEQDKFLFLLYHAAKNNEPRAIYQLGCCLFTGFGCTKDVQAAYDFFKEATMVPFHYDAEFMLGYCYEKGIAVPVNLDEAKRHYWLSMKAAPGRLAALRFAYLCFTTEPKDRLLAMDALLSALGRQWPAEPILDGLQKQYPNGIPFDE